MSEKIVNPRAFEAVFPGPKGGGDGRMYYYERLFQVRFRHTYYPGPGHECPDFDVIPTPTSAEFMNCLGLQFLPEPHGFSILYDVSQKEALFSYLKRQTKEGNAVQQQHENEVWTRISVVLIAKSEFFIDFTRIPINTDAVVSNFYFTNQDAHWVDERIILSPGEWVSRDELEDVFRSQHIVEVKEDVTCVKVRDVSNHTVLCRPRCVPVQLAKIQSPTTISCEDVKQFQVACPEECRNQCMDLYPYDLIARQKCQEECDAACKAMGCVDKIYLDLSLLPEGKYQIEKVHRNRQTLEERVIECDRGIYTIPSPVPLCFMDLFLTDPMPGITHNGIYPVRDLFTDPKIVEVPYDLQFLARKTTWNYFIIPQPDRQLADLAITDEFGLPAFFGPCPVILPNGARAYQFVSMKAITLQKYSKAHFQLVSNGTTILAKRLPVASIQQVFPRDSCLACHDLLAGLQPKAQDCQPCLELIEAICGECCKGLSLQQCKEKTRAHAREQKMMRERSARNFHSRNYSDIFVYV